MDKLLDLLGQLFEHVLEYNTHIRMSSGAINITLTPEKKKYLEEPYGAGNAIGHN